MPSSSVSAVVQKPMRPVAPIVMAPLRSAVLHAGLHAIMGAAPRPVILSALLDHAARLAEPGQPCGRIGSHGGATAVGAGGGATRADAALGGDSPSPASAGEGGTQRA